ncbi:hypothetical protein CFP56_038106 [Quercus suber]|uniref:Uncharacterized protein n=1 Tax=Quercus suber TaxID=58331 RepID=A0AAW0J3V1_QUESU
MGFKTSENALASHPARQNISEKPIVFLAKQPTNSKTERKRRRRVEFLSLTDRDIELERVEMKCLEEEDGWSEEGARPLFDRLDVGGLWQIGGLRKEIEASVCGYGGSVDEMRCLICCWLQVYGSDRGGAGRGLRKKKDVSCSSFEYAAALELGWESFAALVVLLGSNSDLVRAPMVPDTGACPLVSSTSFAINTTAKPQMTENMKNVLEKPRNWKVKVKMCGGWGATYELPAKLHAIINLKTYTIIQVKDQCAEVTRLPAVPLMCVGYI